MPSDDVLLLFGSWFQDETSLMEARGGNPFIPPSLVCVRTLISITDHGHIASQLQKIEEHMISYIQSSLSRFGFVAWCPNLHQTPYATMLPARSLPSTPSNKRLYPTHMPTLLPTFRMSRTWSYSSKCMTTLSITISIIGTSKNVMHQVV